ncbi:hypothetical protein [Sphingobium sp.]
MKPDDGWPWPWMEQGDDALPRWYHWLIAAVFLVALMVIGPVFAAFA